jgi:hypothetical protein
MPRAWMRGREREREREKERANRSSTDIFGKKNRSFFARHDILEKLKLK